MGGKASKLDSDVQDSEIGKGIIDFHASPTFIWLFENSGVINMKMAWSVLDE